MALRPLKRKKKLREHSLSADLKVTSKEARAKLLSARAREHDPFPDADLCGPKPGAARKLKGGDFGTVKSKRRKEAVSGQQSHSPHSNGARGSAVPGASGATNGDVESAKRKKTSEGPVGDNGPSASGAVAKRRKVSKRRGGDVQPSAASAASEKGGGSPPAREGEEEGAAAARPITFREGPPETFDALGLDEWLLATCREMGLRRPTAVQLACIPEILGGRNVVGIAQTGSGKTAAFALPILQRLAADPYGVFAVVLTPTRELALQIADQFRALGAGLRLRDAVVIGGLEMTAQAQRLAQRPHVVVATPGRLLDHLRSDPGMAAVFSRAQFLVLDEADRLLDVGFEAEMGALLRLLPAKRQTLLFSATMTSNLRALEELSLGEGLFRYAAYAGLQTVATLRQEYIFVPANIKELYLCHLMENREAMGVRSAIVFTSTCRSCHMLSLLLAELGIETASLHSLRSQQRRVAALARFRSRQLAVLLATDVAARGLDVPEVDLVVNFDVPRFARDYVHRVGRTARAQRGGAAITLVTQFDVALVHGIEALTGAKLDEHKLEEDEVLKGITKVFKAKRSAILKMSESGFEDLVRARKEAKRKGQSHNDFVND